MKYSTIIHASIYALLCMVLMFVLHLLPVNHLFIDPFSEAIKGHDMMDIAFSKFRDHRDPALFDDRILIINTGATDRKQVAAALDFFSQCEVASIGVDLLFDTVYHTSADTMLQQAIKACPQTILGRTFEMDPATFQTVYGLQSDAFFTSACKQAYVNLATNDGFTIRAFEPFHEIEGTRQAAFATMVATAKDSGLMTELENRCSSTEWINFKRLQPGAQNMIFPINSGQQVHYHMVHIDQFLEDTNSIDKHGLKNKIILMGFCGENELAFSMKDRYFTPLNEQYTGRSLPDMHGVVVHANIISMLLDRDMIHDVSQASIYLLAFLVFWLNYLIFVFLHRKDFFRSLPYIRLIQVFEFFVLLGICILMLLNINIKLGFTFLATCIILSYELFEFYNHKVKMEVELIFDGLNTWVTRNRNIS